MPSDPVLAKHLLATLSSLGGGSIPEDALLIEVEMRSGRPMTTQAGRDLLTFAKSQGWAATREDEWGRDIWWITDKGLNRNATL